jgi:tetratricopeptide (TPR) repeat protein
VAATLAAAAALVLIVRIADPAWLPSFLGGGPRLEALVAALETQPVRPVEGRLMGAGGFAYARPPSPTRGGPDKLGRKWSSDVVIAAAEILKFEGNTSARARAAVGVALIVEGELDAAIVALEEAAKDRPDDAAVHNNLSAAYLARARWSNHPEDWQKAFAAAGRAIKLEPHALEPRFNHALAIEGFERNGLVPEGFFDIDAGPAASAARPSFDGAAARAWADYASRDPNSEWTREAEEHRKALSAP